MALMISDNHAILREISVAALIWISKKAGCFRLRVARVIGERFASKTPKKYWPERESGFYFKAAAFAAWFLISSQSWAAMACLGSIHEPPTQMTLGSLR